MRVVVLAPSIWSEVSVAVVVKLVRAGVVPEGVIALPSAHPATLLRKAMQWGPREFARYAVRRVTSRGAREGLRNPYLADAMDLEGERFANLAEAGRRLGFPVLVTNDVNGPDATAFVASRDADALIYSGGGILRRSILGAPRLGVLNMHIGLLPEVRGMSCPEWSLLTGVPLGVTVHFIDDGIDTGPILLRRELPMDEAPSTIRAVRDRLTAMGTDLVVEALIGLARGDVEPQSQSRRDEDLQHFVIHQQLSRLAERRLTASSGRLHLQSVGPSR